MILIFDCFETLIHSRSMNFNRGLASIWEQYYKEKCSFEEIAAYAQELFHHMSAAHEREDEYAFVKDELPEYAEKYGGDIIQMKPEEEADFLMRCNEMETMPDISEALGKFEKMGIPMYVLSNSSFTADAIAIVFEKLGIRRFFHKIWSSADYGKIKPNKDFFEMAIKYILLDFPKEKRENIIFIGDSYNTDIKGAYNVGIDVIWINHKAESNKDNLAVHNIRNTSELYGIIDSRGKEHVE